MYLIYHTSCISRPIDEVKAEAQRLKAALTLMGLVTRFTLVVKTWQRTKKAATSQPRREQKGKTCGGQIQCWQLSTDGCGGGAIIVKPFFGSFCFSNSGSPTSIYQMPWSSEGSDLLGNFKSSSIWSWIR